MNLEEDTTLIVVAAMRNHWIRGLLHCYEGHWPHLTPGHERVCVFTLKSVKGADLEKRHLSVARANHLHDGSEVGEGLDHFGTLVGGAVEDRRNHHAGMSGGAVANDQVQTGLTGEALRHGDVNEGLTYFRKPWVQRQLSQHKQ